MPADTLFYPPHWAQYDAVVAMYHDQALIPIKTVAFEEAVNVTLGLPIVRTSPDHGTAFDLAGTGRAPRELPRGHRDGRRNDGSHEPDRRPAAAPRGDRGAWAARQEGARAEFPARPQPHRAHRAGRPARSRA